MGKGALSTMHPEHLAATVFTALKERNHLDTADVDDIIWGTSATLGLQGGAIGRMAALDAGYDVRASGVNLNRYCGSGLTATSLAAAQIMSGMEDLVIAGGSEQLSYVNYYGGKMREAASAAAAWAWAIRACRPSTPRPTRASPPTRSPRWRASPAKSSTRSARKASAAPRSRSRTAASPGRPSP